MIRVISWNIAGRKAPWHWLAKMAERDEADIALLQEAKPPPEGLASPVCFENDIHWDRSYYDRWPLVVRLSNRVEVEWFRQVPPWSEIGERDIGYIGSSGIGTMAAARVAPVGRPEQAFIAISMYARWTRAHPSVGKKRRGIYADLSAHRILSDLSTFIDHIDPRRHRILAAGDLNLVYTTTSYGGHFKRERTVWDRFDALGLEFLGPQAPNGRQPELLQPGTSADTKNVPTYYTARQRRAANAVLQLDYAFASRGFHEQVAVQALNGLEEWGPSDHCRLSIEISAPKPLAPRRKLTVEAIRRRAADADVGRQFDRFVEMAEKAGLAVQPQQASVRVAPPANRTRFLMYARPFSNGELEIAVGPKQFAEFFDHIIGEQEAAAALDGVNGVYAGGDELDATLDRIEHFLKDKFPKTDGSG